MLGRRLPDAFGGYPVAFGVTRDPGSGTRHRVEVFGLGGWLSLAARVRPARRRHGAGLAGRAVAAAGGGHRGRRLPRRDGRADPGQGGAELVPARRVAVRAELPVEQDRGGRGVPRPVRRGGRRARLGGGHGPAGARPDAAVAAHAPPLPAVQQVAGQRLRPGPRRRRARPLTWPRRWRRTGWPARERELVLAYRIAAEAHNRLGLTEPLDPGTRPYYDRPYQVLDAGRFAAALSGAITDRGSGGCAPAGAADQVLDSTPALGDLRYARAVTSVSGI